MKNNIRDMCIKDAEGIINVLNPIILHNGLTVLDTPLSLEQEIKFLRSFSHRGIFHVAIGNDGNLLGFQSIEPFATYTHAFDHVATIVKTGSGIDFGHNV